MKKEERTTSSSSQEKYRYLKPCSAQDMTGLIPSGPVGEEEMAAYEELYPFLPEIPKEKQN